ncbi:hypothetical protein [Ramlibacter sp.]|uniref:hypothetical protein n=1 Tax=Ramlibacter sp. TaxID=1917967 RepID=UPI003D0A4A1C
MMMMLAAAAFLPACSDGDDDPLPTVAAVDATIPVTSSTATAVTNVPFSFPSGVPDLGTTAATSIAFTSTASTPAFSISSGTSVATGATTFGSCIFVVANSSFPAGHRLASGSTVTVNPCNIRLGTQGAPSDSVARQRAAVFILGSAASSGTVVTVSVNPGGSITINGRDVGTVTLVQVSG